MLMMSKGTDMICVVALFEVYVHHLLGKFDIDLETAMTEATL